MLLKVLFMQLHVEHRSLLLSRVWQNRVSLFIILEALVNGPPPSVLLEERNHERCVITFPNKSSVELELGPFKV